MILGLAYFSVVYANMSHLESLYTLSGKEIYSEVSETLYT